MSKMSAQKKHIEQIRREKYSIGGNPNPLTKDLHQAVMNLSNELYTRDVHFLMELIQNAEDNHYSEGVNPTLEFIITSKDITATGAPATLLIFNNEQGFSRQNIESICSVGQSTKKGNRSRGYIGEKGIGFKSVFLVTAQPYIFSNGYQIRFNEKPCPNCRIGYIVPEWVDEKPTLFDIKQVYGAGKDSIPATTIILPLKPDKVGPVKEQLSSIHPEVLLFLSKIKHLSVKEENENPKKNTVTAVSISSEVNFETRKNMNAESYTINLSAGENGSDEKGCSYYMWKQKFPVKLENVVERRMDVEECVVTLAFPHQERVDKVKKTRGVKTLPGVYAFLPTQMVTDLPFIIQADFVLASSRETILLDNKWNQGILEYVPSAFVNAFKALVTGLDEAPVSSLPDMFRFLPIHSTPVENFNHVIEKIKEKLAEEKIVPIETFTDKTQFYKPSEVSRLHSQFWKILTAAQEEGVYLRDLFSHEGIKILSSSFDKGKYDAILKFLGVKTVKFNWYANCIQSSNLVDGLSENLYVELLLFVAKNKSFKRSNIIDIPLIKYAAYDGFPYFFTIEECKQKGAGSKRVVLAADLSPTSWLINWNKEFGCVANHYFMPESTQQAISELSSKKTLLDWLEKEVEIHSHNVYSFAKILSSFVKKNSKLSIAYAHFLYHSLSKGYLSSQEVDDLCSSMSLVDRQGRITKSRTGVLLPANVSKWANLMVSNPWRNENYVELGKGYLNASSYAGESTDSGGLIEFLKTHVGASDIPYLSPPNAGFSAADTPLTKDNAFLLLDWIRDLKHKGVHLPERFLECIKEGNWLKVSGSRYIFPSKSFLIGSSLGKFLQNKSVLITIPLIDESFYGDRIYEYKAELETVGVMFNCEEACGFIGKELMSLAASFSLSRNDIFVMLKFIKYHRESLLPLDKYLDSIRKESWLKTSFGLRSPVGSVLNDSRWQVALQISDIPLIDDAYFGEEIYNYKEELKLLGVIVELSGNYQVVIEHLKSPSNLTFLTAEAVHLMMECIRHLNAPASIKLLNLLQGTSCLKTNLGFKTPGECFLYDPVWGCILEVFNCLPIIDHAFYGEKIFSYKHELRQIGVVVDFVYAIEKFACIFEEKASDTSVNQQHVMSFLTCCRQLEGTEYSFPSDFSIVIRKMKWLQTSVGDFRCPKKCILYGPEWESISSITCLPFIDMGIQEYKAELKSIGVVTELKDGLGFVAECLNFPSDPSTISPGSVISLLECIQILMQDSKFTIEGDFRKRLSENWLKTHVGYRPPEKCLFFDSKWSSFVNLTDGPFIDENFYGPNIASFQKELNAIGVISEVEKGCSLLAIHVESLSDHDTIVKIYKYLNEHNWKPEEEEARNIWIPDGNKGGKWVDSKECIVHDPAKLFGSKFYVLEDIYESSILLFFYFAMDVKNKPSLEDYVELWNDWGKSMEQLPYDVCFKFWTSISKHLSPNQEKKLAKSLMKLPTTSGNDEIFLVDKENAFIPDNIHMKKLFEREKVFVWYPQYNMTQLSKSELSDIYRKIGVRNISESLRKEESSQVNDDGELKYVDPNNIFNLKGLVKLILGFLACATPKIELKKRHEAVQRLINSSFHETTEPIDVSYSLSLSSGDIITKKANKRARWESQNCKFIIHKMDVLPGEALKCATSFSEAVSEGILRENHDHIPALFELISLGFVLKFKNEEIDFLMDTKNLHIDPEDEEFLSSAFPYD